MSKYALVADILTKAKEEINVLLIDPQDQAHRLRLEHALDRESNYLSLITGTGDIATKPTNKLGPATSIAGEKIERPKLIVAKDLEPKDEKIEVLKAQVNEAYGIFLTTESKELLKLDHLVLKGVAKKAGLNPKELPAKLNVKAIEEIKAAIKKEQDELDAKIADAETKVKEANEVFAEAYKEYNALALSDDETAKAAATAKCDEANNAYKEAQSILEELLKRKA